MCSIKKNVIYLSNENTIIEDAIFVSPAILRGHPIPAKD